MFRKNLSLEEQKNAVINFALLLMLEELAENLHLTLSTATGLAVFLDMPVETQLEAEEQAQLNLLNRFMSEDEASDNESEYQSDYAPYLPRRNTSVSPSLSSDSEISNPLASIATSYRSSSPNSDTSSSDASSFFKIKVRNNETVKKPNGMSYWLPLNELDNSDGKMTPRAASPISFFHAQAAKSKPNAANYWSVLDESEQDLQSAFKPLNRK